MVVTLVTRDAVRLEFPCAPGQDVMAAAEAAGLYPPSMCHEGSCGLCQARVVDGAYEMGRHSESALPAGPGGVLLCRCLPHGDLTVELPCTDAQVGRHKVPVREAAIEAMGPAGAGAVALTLRLKPDAERGMAADFIPGQYMELTIPGMEIRRAYSLANLPNWDGRLDFIIRLVPGGAFSTWLSERAAVGDALNVRGPLGHFVLDEASPRPRCLVGGGCGMAPILSMLRHMVDFQDPQPVHLIYGANREEELLPEEEIAALRASLPQLGVMLSVWHPGPGWGGFAGTAAQALEAYLANAAETPDIYVCGPPKMLDAVTAVARARGVPEGQIFAERVQS
jgi:NAD(P)H-flavin reductase/ferredoxin